MTSNPTSEGLVERLRFEGSQMAGATVNAHVKAILSEAADRIEALEGEREALRERNRRLKEANDKEHHRLTGAKDKSRARAIRAEQANRELRNQLEGAKEALRAFAKADAFACELHGAPPRGLSRISDWWRSACDQLKVGHFRLAASTLYGLNQEVMASNASLRPTPESADTEAKPSAAFQARVEPWMRECFGDVIPFDKTERGDRLLEEVFELLQSGGYDSARVAQLRDHTWNRPVGEPAQEVGGVMVTLAAYCLAFGLDMHGAGEAELARIWTKVPQIRAKQAAKPPGIALPIAAAGPTERQPEPREAHEKLGEDE